MMNLTIFLISIFIFINTIAYSIYELQHQNKFAGVVVSILAIFMIIFVNMVMFNFNKYPPV